MSEGFNLPSFFLSDRAAVAVKSTSLEELSAVSQLSCNTPMINPMPTTCIDMSLSMPKLAHATGINNSDPPATPDAPHAPIVEIKHNNNAVGKSTLMSIVYAVANDNTAIVIAAPAMLIVAPNGIEIE